MLGLVNYLTVFVCERVEKQQFYRFSHGYIKYVHDFTIICCIFGLVLLINLLIGLLMFVSFQLSNKK